MKTRYGCLPGSRVSLTPVAPSFERFRGEHTTDVVIVGGGLTGCALAFTRWPAPGCRPIVLEAERVGQGSAGRSAGLLLPEPGPSFRDVQQMHGLRATRIDVRGVAAAALDGAALLRRANVRCQLASVESCSCAARDEQVARERDYEARQAAGVESSWLSLKTGSPREPARIRAGAADPRRVHARSVSGTASVWPRRRSSTARASSSSRRCEKVRSAPRTWRSRCAAGRFARRRSSSPPGSATAEFKPLRRHFKSRESYRC